MTAQHTPGPWTAHPNMLVTANHGKTPIAELYDTEGLSVMDANAELIASAPDQQARIAVLEAQNAALLAACEASLERMYPAFYEQPVERIDELIEVLTAAIAAAKEDK